MNYALFSCLKFHFFFIFKLNMLIFFYWIKPFQNVYIPTNQLSLKTPPKPRKLTKQALKLEEYSTASLNFSCWVDPEHRGARTAAHATLTSHRQSYSYEGHKSGRVPVGARLIGGRGGSAVRSASSHTCMQDKAHSVGRQWKETST